jgi:hypothetical protein
VFDRKIKLVCSTNTQQNAFLKDYSMELGREQNLATHRHGVVMGQTKFPAIKQHESVNP